MRTGSRGEVGRGHSPAAVHGLFIAELDVTAAHASAEQPFPTAAQQETQQPGAPGQASGLSQLAAEQLRQQQHQQRAEESEAAVAMYRLLNPATRLYKPRDEHPPRVQPDPGHRNCLAQSQSRAVLSQAVPSAVEDSLQQRPSLSRVRSALQASAGSVATPDVLITRLACLGPGQAKPRSAEAAACLSGSRGPPVR